MEFWIQMAVYLVSIGSMAGTILTRIGYLEKRMDEINDFGERIAAVEQSAKSAHYRMDGLVSPPAKRKKAR